MSGELDRSRTAYQQVPYPGTADPAKHPRTLEAIATLFGMRPAPLPRARVLELGCAGGWNLLPQAVDFPNSHFVGVDRVDEQLEGGRVAIRELQLDNIELRTASLTEVDAAWGEFDYIVCPGVYSWVPQPVQQRILEVCLTNLAPQGVALLSYNTYPGWRNRGMVRDMIQFQTRHYDQPRQQIAAARMVLDFLAKHAGENTDYGRLLKREVEYLSRSSDEYLFHDFIAADNWPLYFYEFVERARAAGLQYVGESQLAAMALTAAPPQTRADLQNASLVEQGQLLDFLSNRAYRWSVLCRPEVKLERHLVPELVKGLWLVLAERPEPAEFDVTSDAPLQLNIQGGTLSVSAPLGKAALQELIHVQPRAVRLETLLDGALRRLPDQAGAADRQQLLDLLAAGMLESCAAGLVHLLVHPPHFEDQVSERPQASPLARWQASRRPLATSQLHQNVALSAVQRLVLMSLDGQKGRGQLATHVAGEVSAGSFEDARLLGERVGQMSGEQLEQMIDATLKELCRAGFLVA